MTGDRHAELSRISRDVQQPVGRRNTPGEPRDYEPGGVEPAENQLIVQGLRQRILQRESLRIRISEIDGYRRIFVRSPSCAGDDLCGYPRQGLRFEVGDVRVGQYRECPS